MVYHAKSRGTMYPIIWWSGFDSLQWDQWLIIHFRNIFDPLSSPTPSSPNSPPSLSSRHQQYTTYVFDFCWNKGLQFHSHFGFLRAAYRACTFVAILATIPLPYFNKKNQTYHFFHFLFLLLLFLLLLLFFFFFQVLICSLMNMWK